MVEQEEWRAAIDTLGKKLQENAQKVKESWEKTPTWRIPLTVWLAALPVWAYSVWYTYEFGVYDRYGLPLGLIGINVTEVIAVVFLVSGSLAMLILLGTFLSAPFLSVEPGYTRFRVAVNAIPPPAFLLVLIGGAAVWFERDPVRVVTIIVGASILCGGLWYLLYRASLTIWLMGRPRWEIQQAAAEEPHLDSLPGSLEAFLRQSNDMAKRAGTREGKFEFLFSKNIALVGIAGLVLFSLLIAMLTGSNVAFYKTVYPVVVKVTPTGEPEAVAVVLDIQESRFICCGLRPPEAGAWFAMAYPDGTTTWVRWIEIGRFSEWHPKLFAPKAAGSDTENP